MSRLSTERIQLRGVGLRYLWGRLAGPLLGAVLGGLPGLGVGLVLGTAVDLGHRRYAARAGDWGRSAASAVERRQLTLLFAAAGRVAKARGRVSESAIARATGLMDELGLEPAARRQAVRVFQRGKQRDFPLSQLARALRRAGGGRGDPSERLLRRLVTVALADGAPFPAQRRVLEDLAASLGLSTERLAVLLGQSRSAGSRAGPKPGPLQASYLELGVAPDADPQAVRQAYRRLLARHHPDRVLARGADEHALKAAQERTQAIRRAYEQIREARGFR